MAGLLTNPVSRPRSAPWAIGKYRIQGTLSKVGVLGSYRVSLFVRGTGMIVATIFSDGLGAYSFERIPSGVYFLVAFDDSGEPVNAAASDYVVPVEMGA